MNTVPTLEILSDMVIVHDEQNGNLRLPVLWMRDNCLCDECRVAQTAEKKFMLSDVQEDLMPQSVSLQENTLLIAWPDGHKTQYDLMHVRALSKPRHPKWRPWPANFKPRYTSWTDFMTGGDATVSALQNLLIDGAIVISDAPCVSGSLELLAPQLGPIRELLFERIHNVKLDLAGYNVAHTALALPPHNDFASLSWPPTIQALHMLQNDVTGGRTIILDSWAVLENFRARHPDLFDCLCRVPVPFSMFDESNITYAEAPLIRCDSQGRITGFRFSNQLMQMVDPNGEEVAGFYRAYHKLCQHLNSTSMRSLFRLQAGHILLVAGHRVLHAREAFQGNGVRHLQDAYFELDNAANRIVVIQQQKARQNVR